MFGPLRTRKDDFIEKKDSLSSITLDHCDTYVMGGPWMAVMAGAKVRYREWLKTGERMFAMTTSNSG